MHANSLKKPDPHCPVQRQPVSFPERYGNLLNKFLLDQRTGNVRLHIRGGKILGLTIEEKFSASP